MIRRIIKNISISFIVIFFTACGTEAPLTEEEIALNIIVQYSEVAKIKPTVSNYKVLGLSEVNKENIEIINSAVEDTDSKGVATVSKIQSLITIVIKKYNKAQTIIQNYADSNTNTQPKVSDYESMGVTGVTEDNLIHMNRAIDNTYSTYVNRKSEVQAIVNRVNKAREIIDAYANDDTEQIPTISDYEIFAVTGITTDNKKEFDALITALDDESVHTTAQMQTLIDSINKSRTIIQNYADSNTNTQPKVSDYESMGVTGVTEDNLIHINRAIDNTYSTYVNRKSEVQAIVNRVIASI